MIIVDMGSGNTCQNDYSAVEEMIEALNDVDSSTINLVVIKWQLFSDSGVNLPLDPHVFEYAVDYADRYSYDTTASVFDWENLEFLLTFNPPFVKIAARPELYHLVDNKHDFIVSVPPRYEEIPNNCEYMCCVPKYPATVKDYEDGFTPEQLSQGISDHTVGFELYHKYQPKLYEKHYVLERDSDNPDAGPFACTPEELKEIL